MDFTDFSSNQIYYLNLLTKFSGRTNRLKLMQPSDMGKKKEVVISENLTFLDIDDQVLFNDCKENIRNAAGYGIGVFFVSFVAGCVYFIKTTPVTKSLWSGTAKSFLFSGMAAIGYYQYHYLAYQKGLQKVYIRMLNNKNKFFERRKQIK